MRDKLVAVLLATLVLGVYSKVTSASDPDVKTKRGKDTGAHDGSLGLVRSNKEHQDVMAKINMSRRKMGKFLKIDKNKNSKMLRSDGNRQIQDVCGLKVVLTPTNPAVTISSPEGKKKTTCKVKVEAPKDWEINFNCSVFKLSQRGRKRERLEVKYKKERRVYWNGFAPIGVVLPGANKIALKYQRKKLKPNESEGFVCTLTAVQEPPTSPCIPATEFYGDCGIRPTPTPGTRIVGGTPAEDNEIPYQVSLITYLPEYTECGGSIITPNIILTAAHCLTKDGVDVDQVDVYYGSNTFVDRSSKTTSRFTIHEDYFNDNLTMVNDIALVYLDSDLELSDSVWPVCLAGVVSDPPQLQELTISGFGEITDYGPLSDELLKAVVDFLPENDCEPLIDLPPNPSTVICTKEDSKGICLFDSGGPVVRLCAENGINRWTQVGVISYGKKPCATYPDVHTRVDSYIGWIRENINNIPTPAPPTTTSSLTISP